LVLQHIVSCRTTRRPPTSPLFPYTTLFRSGLDVTGLTHTQASAMTWDFLKRLRDTTKMKIVLKGILAHEDATLAIENGMDGIIRSEEHTSELQSPYDLVCRLLLEKKKHMKR